MPEIDRNSYRNLDASFTVKDAKRMHVYQYCHIDDLSCIHAPNDAYPKLSEKELSLVVDAVKERFRAAGWEGDGDLGVIWLPPFVDATMDNSCYGTDIWHVKQSNNGVSWIGSLVPLHFSPLADQNQLWESTHVPVSIVFTCRKHLQKEIKQIVQSLKTKLAALQGTRPDSVRIDIHADLLFHAQSTLIMELQDFLDDCYLEVVQDIIQYGNPGKLKLMKLRTQLNPSKYLPRDSDVEDYDQESAKWFTIKGLIGDLCSSFTFEPYKEKLLLLFKTCGYSVPEHISRMFHKHVQLRNCLQHHDGKVIPHALKECGVQEFAIAKNQGQTLVLKAWDRIELTLEELESLGHQLDALATGFDQHMARATASVHWIPQASDDPS